MSASLVGSEMCIRDRVHSSRAANEHLERLAREDAARAQAEQSRVTQETVNEIAALRATVQAMTTGEQALANARAAHVAEVEQVAERQINVEVANAQGLQRELRRVESLAETVQSQVTEQSRQEVELVRNLLSSAEGQSEHSQNRARVLD
eukprot:15479911-Alexandrium_andersonii.AAC.1